MRNKTNIQNGDSDIISNIEPVIIKKSDSIEAPFPSNITMPAPVTNKPVNKHTIMKSATIKNIISLLFIF